MAEITLPIVEQQKPSFGLEASYQRFQNALRDNEHLKRVRFSEGSKDFGWIEKIKDQFGHWKEMKAVADQPIFTDTVTFQSMPESVQHALQVVFQLHPEVLIELDAVLRNEAGSEVERQRSLLRERMRNASFHEMDEIFARLSELDLLESKQQHELISAWLLEVGIPANQINEQVVSEVVLKIFQSAEQWRELVYTRHLLTEATNILCQLVPTMTADIQDVAERMLVLQPRERKKHHFSRLLSEKFFKKDRIPDWKPVLKQRSTEVALPQTEDAVVTPDYEPTLIPVDYEPTPVPLNTVGADDLINEDGGADAATEAETASSSPGENSALNESKRSSLFDENNCETWWSTHSRQNHSAIIMPPHISTDNKDRYGEDLMVTAHELMHAVISEKLGIPTGFHLSAFEHKEVMGTLGRTIHEGISISVEHLLLTAFERDQTELWQAADNVGSERLKYVYKVNRYWNRDRLQELANQQQVKLPQVWQTAVSYSEGVKLALALRRNGWTLADLPQLIDEIKSVISKKTGKKNPNDWARVVVERTPKPPNFIAQSKRLSELFQQTFAPDYQKVIAAIRELKPN